MIFALKILRWVIRICLLPFRLLWRLTRALIGRTVGGTDTGTENATASAAVETTAAGDAAATGRSGDASGGLVDRLVRPPTARYFGGMLIFYGALQLLTLFGLADSLSGSLFRIFFLTPITSDIYILLHVDLGTTLSALLYAGLFVSLGAAMISDASALVRRAVRAFAATNAAAFVLLPVFVSLRYPVSFGRIYGDRLFTFVFYVMLMGAIYWNAGRATPNATSSQTVERSTTDDTDAPESDITSSPTRTDSTPVGGASTASSERDAADREQASDETETEPTTSLDPEPVASTGTQANTTATNAPDTSGGSEATPAPEQDDADADDTPPESESTDADDTPPEQDDVDADDAPPESEATDADDAPPLSAFPAGDADDRLTAAERLHDRATTAPADVDTESAVEAFEAETDEEIRLRLVDVLGELDDERARDALRDACFDQNPTVSRRATNLLD